MNKNTDSMASVTDRWTTYLFAPLDMGQCGVCVDALDGRVTALGYQGIWTSELIEWG